MTPCFNPSFGFRPIQTGNINGTTRPEVVSIPRSGLGLFRRRAGCTSQSSLYGVSIPRSGLGLFRRMTSFSCLKMIEHRFQSLVRV